MHQRPFEVGDRVRLTGYEWKDRQGLTAIVTQGGTWDDAAMAKIDDLNYDIYIHEDPDAHWGATIMTDTPVESDDAYSFEVEIKFQQGRVVRVEKLRNADFVFLSVEYDDGEGTATMLKGEALDELITVLQYAQMKERENSENS